MLCALFSIMGTACRDKKDSPTVIPPVRVSAIAVIPNQDASSTTYSGTVSSASTTTVSFSISGTITALYAKEGQNVSKGQLLGIVRDADYVNALNIAEAQLAEAQDGYERLKKLHDANALPDVKWVEMQQKLKQAQNAVEISQRAVEDARLYSPVSGTVTSKMADVGQTIVPVQPIYEIVSTSDITVDISVTESEIGNFSPGRKATVRFDNPEIPEVTGTVSSRNVVADPLTRGYLVKVAIPSEQGKVLPGMLAEVAFESPAATDMAEEIITLPSQAVLLNSDNRMFVWLVKNSEAQRRFVEIGGLNSNGVVIKSGLNRGDSVIVAGMQKVGSGTKVAIVN